jgi:hypothetical protein
MISLYFGMVLLLTLTIVEEQEICYIIYLYVTHVTIITGLDKLLLCLCIVFKPGHRSYI